MTRSQFIHSSVDRHLDCFYFLVIINNVSPNIHVQILTWIYVFISLFIFLEYIFFQIGIAELYCNSVANPLKNNQTVLQSGWATSQWSPPRTRVLVSPHHCQYLVLYAFFEYSHPGGCEVVAHCVLICISLMANESIFHLLIGHFPIFLREIFI